MRPDQLMLMGLGGWRSGDLRRSRATGSDRGRLSSEIAVARTAVSGLRADSAAHDAQHQTVFRPQACSLQRPQGMAMGTLWNGIAVSIAATDTAVWISRDGSIFVHAVSINATAIKMNDSRRRLVARIHKI